MTTPLNQFAQPFDFDRLQQIVVVNGAIGRLLMACLLGGVVGLQREIRRKAAGVRTNLLICMGSAFFTLLSAVLAGDANPDKGRVASNIVQGIGFLGAGLILHNRSRVSGLTSAATVFVVASIGMSCGAGLYAAAAVAALIVIVALEVVGFLERRGNLKGYPLVYEARGRDKTSMLQSILDAMDKAGERLTGVEHDAIGDLQRVTFALTATKRKHERVRGRLLAEPAIDSLFTFRDPEED
ncbi:MAG: MgtC/SapB family protein [Terracidiphilus sp.]|nr:MgtC/SapB family protein [Terracidiphilus sp.]MDR3775925.1 MgtC/SapB family protein [Terracidiphilus sp.]